MYSVDYRTRLWIRHISLENIRCFENVHLDFKENGGHEKFTVFLGDNGSGKSTILKAIALAIAGRASISWLVPDGSQWVRAGKDEGVVEAEINKSPDDSELFSNITVKIKFKKSVRTPFWESDKEISDFPPYAGWLAAGYGPFRVPPSLSERKEFYESVEEPRISRVINLFQPRSKLISLDSWLKELDYERLKQGKSSLGVFIDAIHDLLPHDFPIRFSEINKEGFAVFTTPYGNITLDNLSDGYRSMIVWVSDLLRNMMLAFPNSTNILSSSGILLLDELDVHLHPHWQREIVSSLTKFFPNFQIISTTHSPLVIQGIKQGKVVLCKRTENGVILDDDLPSVEGWRADELLEDNDFFGVNVYDNETQNQLDKHSQLIAKTSLTNQEEKELASIAEDLKSKRVVEPTIPDLDYRKVKNLAKKVEELKREKDKASGEVKDGDPG